MKSLATGMKASQIEAPRAKILLVDDNVDVLRSMTAVLESLGEEILTATNANEALRHLLKADPAAIVLDVMMPEVDGFQLAALIRKRERFRHTPIIFLAGLGKDDRHMLQGYQSGAADYLLKPVDPDVLRAKVRIFVELSKNNEMLRRYAEVLQANSAKLEEALDSALRANLDLERERLLQRTLAAERASQETLALCQFLTEALPIYVWMGEAGKFEFCNRHVLEFTGLSFEQIQAGGTFELIHPDDRQRFIDTSLASLRSGEPLTIEYRIRRADGVYRWHFARSSQFPGPSGRVKWLGTAIDLTERKIAEEELRASEERLQLAQTAGGIGMWDWDLVTNEVRWSPEYYAHFGLRPGEREPSFANFLNSVHSKDRESVKKAAVEASINSSGKFSREFRVPWPDGSLHWLFYQGQVLRNELDEPVRMIGICSDITTRKLAEQELRSANERLGLALSTAQMGDWEWDIRENKIRWAEEVCRMHGVTQFDGRFESWFSSVHPDDRSLAQAAIDRTLRTGEDYELEYRTLRPDGSEYWTLARGVLKRDPQGIPVRLIGVCMDINSRKKSEEAIRRSEKLAAAGRLAASVSHEINNPLESVTNLLYLMNTSPELPPDIRRYLNMAQSELARISQIATQTLRFYRQSTSPGWAEIPALLESVISLYQARLAGANVNVVQEVSAVPQVFCYEGELRQIFVNLVGNALDAMAGRGGQLTLRVRKVRSIADRDEIRVTIADTGAGISPESRKHLFEPFFTTKGNTGTGLGLWLSQSMVHKHNGVMRVRTRCEAPSGTVFMISLPLRAAGLEQSSQD